MMGRVSVFRTPAITALALALGACSTATSPYAPAPIGELKPPNPATVRPGDVVVINFWQQPDISGERIVDDNGKIQLPLLFDVQVAGLSAEQIREQLTELYGQYFTDPLIVVNVKLGVIVTGAVDRPGRFLVDPGFNIFDALGLAGGENVEAKRSGVILYRDGKAFEISLNEAALATDPAKLRVQSGDWIYVPTRFFSLQRATVYLTIVVLGVSIANFFVR